jgi:molybdenum cofactor cytidylyltransferase
VISAILPAAGESRRMGRPKLLLPFGDTTVVGATLRALRCGGVDRVALVIAAGDDALRAWAEVAEVEVAENPRPERGMLSSVHCGLEALGGDEKLASAGGILLVMPADMPTVDPATVRRLVETARDPASPLTVPVYRGKRGHPLVISASPLRDLANLDPAVGLRQLLERHAVTELPVDDAGVVTDVDTPAEYQRLQGGPATSAPPR